MIPSLLPLDVQGGIKGGLDLAPSCAKAKGEGNHKGCPTLRALFTCAKRARIQRVGGRWIGRFLVRPLGEFDAVFTQGFSPAFVGLFFSAFFSACFRFGDGSLTGFSADFGFGLEHSSCSFDGQGDDGYIGPVELSGG